MPRANRVFCSGLVWHITQRCHQKKFLLKFARDRKRWTHWLFQAKKRYGLSVLNYIVTSNHIHLLVHDQGNNEIASSMQLISGRVGQEFNNRKNRRGAFWEDRYHATAIQTDTHLFRCLIYIDLNMVRAGVVNHPGQWPHSGFYEMRSNPARRRRHDLEAITELFGYNCIDKFMSDRHQALEAYLDKGNLQRQPEWTETIAVGNTKYLVETKQKLGQAGRYRQIYCVDSGGILKDNANTYRP